MWERYRHTIENTPRQVGRAKRILSFYGGIFGWDVAFTLNVPLQMADMLPSIRRLVLICSIRGGKHTSIPCRDGGQWEPY